MEKLSCIPVPYQTSPKQDNFSVRGFVMDVAIRCTQVNCPCEGFVPGGAKTTSTSDNSLRTCSSCYHGWIAHALDKLMVRRVDSKRKEPEPVEVSGAFDVASLILFGTDALPMNLKMLLECLFDALCQSDVQHILKAFCWTSDDFTRGYKKKNPSEGSPLMRWTTVNKEEEELVMRQFLLFNETRSLAQSLVRQEVQQPGSSAERQPPPGSEGRQGASRSPSAGRASPASGRTHSAAKSSSLDSDIKKLIEKAHRTANAAALAAAGAVNSSSSSSVHRVRDSCHQATGQPKSTSPSPRSSPLNRLQSMQPFDFRRMASSHQPSGSSSSLVQMQQHHHQLLHSDTPTLHSSSLTSPGPGHSTRKSSTASPPAGHMSSHHHLALNFAHHGGNGGGNGGTGSGYSVNSDLSVTDDEDDMGSNMSESAMNLSQAHGMGQFNEMKERSRKSSNPMKRRWNPVVLSTLTTNPATGKRRVQCHSCFKTFCDKGALKIHYSAVHLREMHKCTVDGCTMMFSSRRSRNRHSANPNPKLHSSSMRRKINPHDGRSSNPFPSSIMTPPGASSILNYVSGLSGPLLGHSPTSFSNPLALSEAERINAELSQMTSSSSVGHREEEDDGAQSPGSSRSQSPESYHGRHSNKMAKVYNDEDDIEYDANELKRNQANVDLNRSSNGFDGLGLSSHNSSSRRVSTEPTEARGNGTSGGGGGVSGGGGRKRKSQNPTKCAVSVAPGVSDDDLQYSSDTSNSNDTFGDQGVDMNGMDDIKSEEDDDEDDDSLQDLLDRQRANLLHQQLAKLEKNRKLMKAAAASHRNDNDENKEEADRKRRARDSSERDARDGAVAAMAADGFGVDLSKKRKRQSSPLGMNGSESVRTLSEAEARSKNASQYRHQHQHHGKERTTESGSSPSSGVAGVENPLRHLESLSLGPFSNLVHVNSHFRGGATASGLFNGPPSLSFHAPGLGLALPPSAASQLPTSGSSSSIESSRKLKEKDLRSLRENNEPLASSGLEGLLLHHSSTGLASASLRARDALRDRGRERERERERERDRDGSGSNVDREDEDGLDMEGNEANSGGANTAVSDLDASFMSGEHVPSSMVSMFRDSGMNGPIEIPVDKENPRRCVACGKIFQNHFGVKTHYQNVHLKLMHKCTVEGCNAAFPSKRSRDRHSANLNLHRKLLSTHSDKEGHEMLLRQWAASGGSSLTNNNLTDHNAPNHSGLPFGLDKVAAGLLPYHGANIRDEFFSRLYDPQGLPLSLNDLYLAGRIPGMGSDPAGLLAAAQLEVAFGRAGRGGPVDEAMFKPLQRQDDEDSAHST
ncbi:Zinc finger protein basonuclin-2 [Halotydeus destructor]|nr:Zinc finger protein basonuclin-2 [Halotydeus destructor]